jgi:hypothetical protein
MQVTVLFVLAKRIAGDYGLKGTYTTETGSGLSESKEECESERQLLLSVVRRDQETSTCWETGLDYAHQETNAKKTMIRLSKTLAHSEKT